jgi:predicted SnoaL-like aldol condensation-catalyzing enzyme
MKTMKPKLLVVLIIGILCFSASGQRRSKRTTRMSPEQVVADLYRQHKTRSPFFQNQSRALVDRYFDKNLADLIWNQPNSPDEVGPLDGDPLYNAQDMEIKNFAIHKPVIKNGNATVLVTFTNFGKTEEIKFLLASAQGGWKITNIKYDDGTNLIGILKQ